MQTSDSPVAPPKSMIAFAGKIHLIVNDQMLDKFLPEMSPITEFGFDTETRPSFRKGEVYQTALLQLATLDTAYLIRLHGITQFGGIKSIFENKEVLKVGAAIRDDITALKKLFSFEPQNFVELQTLAKSKEVKNMGLKGMTEEVLDSTISKGPKTTNWEAPHLTDRQLLYAATDAWIGLKIFHKLQS